MKILIAGASGFIGTTLTEELAKNHHITVLGRDLNRLEQLFSSKIKKITWNNLLEHNAKEYDLIINLSGANIGAKRWNSCVKKELIESRTVTNSKLIEWLIKYEAMPHYYCANAIGIYGSEYISEKAFDEEYPISLDCDSNNDFLKEIGLKWEKSLEPAIKRGIPVTTLRFGVVLKKGEGMLKKLELPFRFGLGAILGSGNQTLSWVYYKDLIKAIGFIIARPEITGPINITSPNAVTQKEFAMQFAKALKRFVFLKMPSKMIKVMFGEMGEYLLLKGQKVVPKRLIELGFKFDNPNLEGVLKEEFKSN